jgi:predicted Zn-dependent peptidase
LVGGPVKGTRVPDPLYLHQFANGLTLLAERIPTVRSAAFNFLIPAGCIYDPPGQAGLANLLSDLIMRGAGARSSREVMLALDSLGLDRDQSAGIYHQRFWGSTLARNVLPALEIYADVLRRPHLPAEELPAVKALALQDLAGLEDEPRQKVMIEVKKRHFPPPLGRDRRGDAAGIQSCRAEAIRAFYQRTFSPTGAILSVAGDLQWDALKALVERCFGDWEPLPAPTYELEPPLPRRDHLPKETHQTQIGMAYDTAPLTHPDYYSALGAVSVLSGGMSARLFTEVREKRGLCYAVWASYQTLKDRACVVCYAGSTNERAQETLDVARQVLASLGAGVAPDEVQRVQAGLKSALIMQEESTSARAGAIAADWFYLGRVRGFAEIQAGIDSLTADSIAAFARAYPPRDLTLVTLGPRPLELH